MKRNKERAEILHTIILDLLHTAACSSSATAVIEYYFQYQYEERASRLMGIVHIIQRRRGSGWGAMHRIDWGDG